MNFRTRTAALVAGLLMVSTLVTGCSGSGSSSSNATLTVADIQKAVETDISKFTKAHDDKPIQVSGYFAQAQGTQIFLAPTADDANQGMGYLGFVVKVDVPSSDADGLAVGSEVTVQGTLASTVYENAWITSGHVISVQPPVGGVSQPTTGTSATPAVTPSATQAVPPDVTGDQTVTTKDGYVLEVSWAFYNPGVEVGDGLNDPPGKTSLNWVSRGQNEVKITNHTPGKNADAGVYGPFGSVEFTADATKFMAPNYYSQYGPMIWDDVDFHATPDSMKTIEQGYLEPEQTLTFYYSPWDLHKSVGPFDNSLIQGADLSFLGDVTYHFWLNNSTMHDGNADPNQKLQVF